MRKFFGFLLGAASIVLMLIATLSLSTPHSVQAHVDRKAEGAEIFATTGCMHCHGTTAQGTEKGPSLRDVRTHLTAEKMHKQIVEGGQTMPSFSEVLNEEQITAVIEMLRTKHPEKLLAAVPADKISH